MKLFQRYLASHYILPFFISMLFLVIFLLTFQLFRILNLVVSKGVSFLSLLEMMMYIAISYSPMAFPLSIFFAMLYTLNKLSEDSEIIALRSFGITKFKMLWPYLLTTFFISITVYCLNSNIIPYAQREFKNSIVRLSAQGQIVDIKPGTFFTEIKGVTLFAESVKNKGTELGNIFIHTLKKDEQGESIVFASSGKLIKFGDEKSSFSSIRLQLIHGNITNITYDGQSAEKILFETYEFPIFNTDISGSLVNRDSMRDSKDLYALMKTKWKEIKSGTMESTRDFRKTELEFWDRLKTPIECLIFMLLGFTLGIKKGRGRGRGGAGIGVILLVVYYAIYFTGVSLATKGTLPPVLVTFLPGFLLMGLISYLYKRLDWAA